MCIILIFHGELNCHKNTNILVEWLLSPLASSCIFPDQFSMRIRDHTLMTSGKIRKFLTPPSPLVGLRRWKHTPPPLWDFGIVGTPPPPLPPPSCFSPQSPPPPSCPLSPPHQRSYTKIRKFSTQLNQVLTSK